MTLRQICEKYKINYHSDDFLDILKSIYYSPDPKGFFQAIQDEEVNKGEEFFNFRPVCFLDEKINWYINNTLPLKELDETRTNIYKASAEYQIWKFFNTFLRETEEPFVIMKDLDKKQLETNIVDATISCIMFYGKDDYTEGLSATRNWWNEIKENANKYAFKEKEQDALTVGKDLIQVAISNKSLEFRLSVIIAIGILCGIEFDF